MAASTPIGGVRFCHLFGPRTESHRAWRLVLHGSATGCDAAVDRHGVAIDERLVVEDRGRGGTQSYALAKPRAADLKEPLLVTYRLPAPMRTAVGCL